MKILYFNYSISQYHFARFSQLKKHIKDDIKIIELASKDKIYPWNSMAQRINAITLFPDEVFDTINPQKIADRVNQLLDLERPDVVISISYAKAPMRTAAIWAKINKAVSIGISDSWKGDKPRYFPWEAAKGIWCRLFYDCMFLSGARSKAYYSGIGFPENRIWLGQNAVDNDFYSIQSTKIKKSERIHRVQYQLPDKFFLCVARLSPEKNIERLLKAYAIYKGGQGTWNLVIVGSGPQENNLKNLAKTLDIEEKVHFLGWKQMDEMPIFYGLASCLILPSLSEPWGIVVNEAMASGLPVLVSKKCGCSPDLCRKGVNGFQFDPYKIFDIADSMLKLSTGSYDIEKMGNKSKEIIATFSLENYTLSFIDMLTTSIKFRKHA